MQFRFDWDPAKEAQNIRKHGIGFRRAAAVFGDPNQLSIYDEEHSAYEDRWITMGFDATGILCIVVHTFVPMGDDLCEIRIISARKAARTEVRQYQERSL